jgi:hypothetical protein
MYGGEELDFGRDVGGYLILIQHSSASSFSHLQYARQHSYKLEGGCYAEGEKTRVALIDAYGCRVKHWCIFPK